MLVFLINILGFIQNNDEIRYEWVKQLLKKSTEPLHKKHK